jgi:hypothetical protein
MSKELEMRRSLPCMLAAVVLVAACESADRSLVGIDRPLFDHAGPDKANHTHIPKPVFTAATLSGGVANLSWTWDDVAQGGDWDLVSFEVKRDGVEAPGGDDVPNQKPYSYMTDGVLERSFSESGLGSGPYEYCVEVMAKDDPIPGQGQPMTFHSFECVVVQEAAWSIDVIGGNVANSNLNANTATFTVTFNLLNGGVAVTDCDETVYVSLSGGAWFAADCTDGEYHANFANPSPGTATDYLISFSLDASGAPVIGTHAFSTTSPGGAGGVGGASAR